MNSLESRKKLLIAESELNRTQLAQEWQAMADQVHALTHKAKTIGGLASAATVLSSLLIFRRKNPGRSPWWQAALKGTGLMASLWQMFRSPPKS